jgi:hypothetical protein
MKNVVFWDVTPCVSCKNRRFGGTYRLLHRVTRIGELGTTLALTTDARREEIPGNGIFLRSVRLLLVTYSVVPRSPILVTLMIEELSSSETSVLTRFTWRNIPEDAILHLNRSENLKTKICKLILQILWDLPV